MQFIVTYVIGLFFLIYLMMINSGEGGLFMGLVFMLVVGLVEKIHEFSLHTTISNSTVGLQLSKRIFIPVLRITKNVVFNPFVRIIITNNVIMVIRVPIIHTSCISFNIYLF